MIQDAIERVLSLSRADACMVIASESSEANVRWANNSSTTNGVSRNTELFVVSVIGRRVGTAGATHVPEDRLESLVRRSEAACEGRPEAEDFMPLLDGDGEPADWGMPLEEPGIDVFGGMAPELGETFARARKDAVALFGYAEHTTSARYLASSTGLRRRHVQHEGRLEVTAKTPDFTRSTWAGQSTARFDDVDLPALYDRLGQRLAWSATSLDMPAGHYQVVLEPAAVADMLVYAYWTATAREADEGRTVFSRPGGGNRIGERLCPPGLTLYSDPREPGLEVAPFVLTAASSSHASVFDNGQEASRTDWLRDGVLEALITTRAWAARSGSPVRPYVDNLVLASTAARHAEQPDAEQMVAATERALLVTCFWYIREVDPQTLLLTGLTRDGVFLVEDGQVKGAVNNFRFNMSPIEMLAQTVEVGRSGATLPREFADYFRFSRMPPLRVDAFNMSSVSRAT